MVQRLLFALMLLSYSASNVLALEPSGTSAREALSALKAGNARFVAGKAQHPLQTSARLKELVSGQKPHTILLSCSDSRVPPELIFDQGFGQIFSVRVAGNVIGSDEVASIEYAVEHLGVKLLVVMGHDRCGAMKAALETKYGQAGATPDLTTLVSTIQKNLGPDLERYAAEAEHDPVMRGAVAANVYSTIRSLRDRSEIVFRKVRDKQLEVVPALYHLDSGRVEFLPEVAPPRKGLIVGH